MSQSSSATSEEYRPPRQRLAAGAKVLGELWRSGQRCASGWSRACACPGRTDFCEAKLRWIGIAETLADDRILADVSFGDPHWIVMAMTEEDLRFSGLTVSMETFGKYAIRVGPKGNVPVDEFFRLGEDLPLLARTAFMIVDKAEAKIIPGAR